MAPSTPRPAGSVPIRSTVGSPDEALPGPGDDQAAAAERSADARLARLHLRGGLLPLARAALEQMAGAGTLDGPAMADLAEARWRSGDLEGAADAARAHQASGGAEPMAALILAEDLMRTGQAADARRYAEFVVARAGSAADQLFALEPRSPIWPPADDGWMAHGADAPGHWGLLVGGSEVAAPTPRTWLVEPIVAPASSLDPGAALQPAPTGRGAAASVSGPLSTTAVVMSGRLAGEELERVDRSLASGDVRGAAGRLAVLLRLDPALAPVILSAAERAAIAKPLAGGDLSAVHLVRGDAYRILGRENEAAAAYRLAHQALSLGPAREDHP
ncbi:MAG TPA: hypothetical protein VFF55_07365 [Candidatus Deferrimicrobium sp.]|nr:hypothetical protein [Candidatus Deferrimicrobium sp.]